MNTLHLSLLLFCLLSLLNCTSEPVTGSEDVVLIQETLITIDTTYAFGNDFKAEGTVTYTGNASITPIWYLEGAFFRDETKSFKFGGDNMAFNFSLSKNQSTGWILSFNDPNYPASNYPDFVVAELRVYKYADD